MKWTNIITATIIKFSIGKLDLVSEIAISADDHPSLVPQLCHWILHLNLFPQVQWPHMVMLLVLAGCDSWVFFCGLA